MHSKAVTIEKQPFDLPLDQVHSLINVWNVIEILTPSDMKTLQEYCDDLDKIRNKRERVKIRSDYEELYRLEDLPHLNPEHNKSENRDGFESKIYWHVYIGYLNWTEAENAIETKMETLFGKSNDSFNPNKSDSKYKKKPKLTSMAGFMMDERGLIDVNSILISNSVWAFGQIMRAESKDDLALLEDYQEHISKILNELVLEFHGLYSTEVPLGMDAIEFLYTKLLEKLKIDQKYMLIKDNICIKKIKRQRKTNTKNVQETNPLDTAPPLDLFTNNFVDALKLVQQNLSKLTPSTAIGKYLGLASKPNSPNVLENRDTLKDLLSPLNTSLSRWPSSPHQTLAALQAGAQSAILKPNESPDVGQLFAINGPPGTGKTTLLFDLIVNIYVTRAAHLTTLVNPEDGFQKNMRLESPGFTYNVRDLIPSLFGYEIVIASSNNNAVANITKEVSLKSNVDPLYDDMIKQFKDVFTTAKDEAEAWGVFAAPLGNSRNISAFRNKFYADDSKKSPASGANDAQNAGSKIRFFEYLTTIKNDLKNSTDQALQQELKMKWKEETASFKHIQDRIIFVLKRLDHFVKEDRKIRQLSSKYSQDGIVVAFENLNSCYNGLKSEIDIYHSELDGIKIELSRMRLGFWEWAHKLFKTKKYMTFLDHVHVLLKQKTKLMRELNNSKKKLFDQETTQKQIEADYAKFIRMETELRSSREYLTSLGFNLDRIEKDAFWQLDETNFNISIPYHSPEFEKLRTALFSQALKVHELFVLANASTFWNGLTLLKAVLSNSFPEGKLTPEKINMTQAAWRNFFMVVPVVSSTFASFDEMFQEFGLEDIGWLFIDEAGQASPQQAVGAIYRSKNVIIVGDPLQTEPISVLGKSLIDCLFENHQLSSRSWSPAYVSTQSIADRNSPYQAKYGEDTVVGFPLLTHRRCQEPMFSICNSLAYDNKMIYAVKESVSPLSPILGKSRWFDVVDSNAVSKAYESEAEYVLLFKMIKKILEQKNYQDLLKSIYVITFYKKYSEIIKKKLNEAYEHTRYEGDIKSFCASSVGTIHAFQGKENDTVIMMLGAQYSGDRGARNVMVEKPNVLNVGVSRAKRNLYVIGNRALWYPFDNIKILADKLEEYGREEALFPLGYASAVAAQGGIV